MKYPFLPLLAVFILLHGCISSGDTISPDETAKKIFTRAELEGFDRMIHFVDSTVSAKTGLTGINESYNAYIDKLSSDVFSGGNFTPLVNDASKFQFLELIDNEAFSAIWGKQTIHLDWSSRPIQMLYLNSEGKYKRYLQKVGESDEWYARIYEETDRSGDFSPVIIARFLKNHHEHDFTLYKHRLWATVFLLNIAEPLEVSERYKENQAVE